MNSRRTWPLLIIGLPAAVAIWSGWVGLGGMAGFGPIHPLPGIADGFTINSAITLPIGVEAYSAYALGVWLSARPIPERARRFACRSSLGALGLGLLGQAAYHALAALHMVRAPLPVVLFVACLPVLVLGAASTLHYLIGHSPSMAGARRREQSVTFERASGATPGPVGGLSPEPAPELSAPGDSPSVPTVELSAPLSAPEVEPPPLRAVLDSMPTDAARIRHVSRTLDTTNPVTVADTLSAAGHFVRPDTIRRTIRRDRAAGETDPGTGSIPVVRDAEPPGEPVIPAARTNGHPTLRALPTGPTEPVDGAG
jgi:hypothetical protein